MNNNTFIPAVLFVFCIFAIGAVSSYAFQNVFVEPEQEIQSDTEKLVEEILIEVEKLIDLSNEPVPTVARILDVETLRTEHEFYKHAENGDFLIVTTNMAYVYRKEEGKILHKAPITRP